MATYAMLAESLAAMADKRDQHVVADPECGAGPLCCGPDVVSDVQSIVIIDKWTAVLMLMTAVGEISRLRWQVAAADDSAIWMREQLDRLQSRVNELTAADWDAALREVADADDA